MTGIPEKKEALLGPSEMRCRECGTVEQIRSDWQRCYMCFVRCETRNTKTYPSVCPACCRKLH